MPLSDHIEEIRQLIETGQFHEGARKLDTRRMSYRVLKRTCDVIVSGTVILVGALPSIVLCVLIRWSTGGSPIYSQTRMGLYGRPFRIYKFRTMVADSDDVKKYFTTEQYVLWKRERKVDNDPRITRLGRILRSTSVDEFPNFINVFLGQMSTVGPRAIAEDELKWYGRRAPELLSVTPGITGWWQVTDRNDAMYETGARQHRELFYVSNASLAMDVRVIFMTIGAMFSRTGR